MKIVNRQTFLAMEEQVLFAKYDSCCFGEIAIKVESCNDVDFFVQELMELDCSNSDEMIKEMRKAEADPSHSMNLDLDCIGRDGCFDEGQLFTIFEPEDLDRLIKRLQKIQESAP